MVCVSEREMRQTDDRMKERKKERKRVHQQRATWERTRATCGSWDFFVYCRCAHQMYVTHQKFVVYFMPKWKQKNRKTNLQNLGTLLKWWWCASCVRCRVRICLCVCYMNFGCYFVAIPYFEIITIRSAQYSSSSFLSLSFSSTEPKIKKKIRERKG